MRNVIVCKGRNKEIAVVIIRLHPQVNALLDPSFLCSGYEVLWEQLALFVEIVSGPLNMY